MLNKALCTAGLLCFSIAGFAQASIGTLANVTGPVTLNDGSTVVNGINGTSFGSGSRIVTSSTGGATLRLANGCVVDLKPNQAVTVLASTSCAELVASVQTTGVAGPAQANFSVGDAVIVGTGALITIRVLDRIRNRNISGS